MSYVFHSLLSASLWELHEQRAKVCGNAHYRVDTRWGLVPTFLPCLKWSILSVQFSRSVVSDSLWPHGPQHARSPCPSPTPGVYSNSCPSSQWCHSTISSSAFPLLLPSIFPHWRLFQWVSSLHQVAQVLEFQLQHQSFQWIFRIDFL